MSTPSFFLPYESHAQQTLSEFEAALHDVRSKVLADVTIGDLCAMSEHPNGLYFFFDGEPRKLQYVGKCTSRSFVERVPAHFDQREDAWFNTLPTKLTKNGKTYSEALSEALRFQVVLLGIREADSAMELERVFRHSYRPTLNTPKKLKPFDANATLACLAET